MNSTIGKALFTKTQQKVLGLLYGKPENTFYLNEIVRLAGIGKGTIKRELEKMKVADILTVERVGNQTHYQANPDCPIFEELLNIVRKSAVLVDIGVVGMNNDDTVSVGNKVSVSRKALLMLIKRYHIKRLNLFGSAARGELRPQSDIDLMIEFEPGQAPSLWASQQLQDDFSHLFGGRSVDIASPEILRNPYRRKTIEADLKVLYEAA